MRKSIPKTKGSGDLSTTAGMMIDLLVFCVLKNIGGIF